MTADLPERVEADELTLLGRLGVMVNVGTLTAMIMLIPSALVAGSGHFGESFDPTVFGVVLAGSIALMLALCLWTPFAKKARALAGLWSVC